MMSRLQTVMPSVRRTSCLAEMVWREGIRQRLLHGFGLVFLLFLGGAAFLKTLHFGSGSDGFVLHLGLAAISLFGSAFSVLCTVQFFFGDLETQAVLTLFAKPVRRFEFILGKWMGVAVLLGVFCMAATGILALHLSLSEHGGSAGTHPSISNLWVAGCLVWTRCSVVAASVVLISALVRGRLLALVAGFVLLFLGHVRPVMEQALRGIEPPALRMVVAGLTRAIPDLRAFATEAGGGSNGIALSFAFVAGAVTYGMLFLLGTLTAAGLIFQKREL